MKKPGNLCLILSLNLLLLGTVFLTVGKYPISVKDSVLIIANRILPLNLNFSPAMETVVFNVRIPRIIAAILIGGCLSAAGSAYQGIFNNPLISPDILGATAGSSFGASLAIIMSGSIAAIQASSFLFGLLAVFAACFISIKVKHGNQTLILILSGILTGTVFNSLVSLIKFIADPEVRLPAITFWLLGSLSSVGLDDVTLLALPCLTGIAVLFLIRWNLNVLSFSDDEAKTLGIDTNRVRLIIIFFSTLMTAASVSISGVIGWIGLVIPNLTRIMFGPDYRTLLPASFLIGGTYLLIIDTIARTLFPVEIPLGIITSLIGAPFYIWLLARAGRNMS